MSEHFTNPGPLPTQEPSMPVEPQTFPTETEKPFSAGNHVPEMPAQAPLSRPDAPAEAPEKE